MLASIFKDEYVHYPELQVVAPTDLTLSLRPVNRSRRDIGNHSKVQVLILHKCKCATRCNKIASE